MADNIQEILRFWFEEVGADRWFKSTLELDAAIRARFFALYERAAVFELDDWCDAADGSLALTLLLDQFPRNIFRGDARAYATDGLALACARDAIARKFDMAHAADRRIFVYIPFEHSEDLADQKLFVELVTPLRRTSGNSKDTVEHMEIIERFGRFPHRNHILSRVNTPEEEVYLSGNYNAFGTDLTAGVQKQRP